MWWDVLVTVCTAVGAMYLIGVVPVYLLVITVDKQGIKRLGHCYALSSALGWPGLIVPVPSDDREMGGS